MLQVRYPDSAIAEFAKAGYTFQNGKLLDKNGKQLELKLVYGPNTSKTRELIAVTVQDQLSKVGIKVDVQALEWSSFLQAIQAEKPDWDMYIGGWAVHHRAAHHVHHLVASRASRT